MGPPSIRRRSRSRETRAALLEKLNQTKSALYEAWENTPQRKRPPSNRRRSRSRETRAASLEKLNQTGSIKIKKSLCVDRKTRYSAENRSASRQESREIEGESSSWTDSEEDIDKRKEGGIHVIGKSFNCKSRKNSSDSAQARKMDTS